MQNMHKLGLETLLRALNTF